MPEHDLKSLQSEAKRLSALFKAFASIKAHSKAFPEEMRKVLNRMPDHQEAAKAIERIRVDGAAIAEREANARSAAFKTNEAAFINSLKSQGVSLRELNRSWRIGPLEVEVRRETSEARTLYNREPVLAWSSIAAPEDFDDLWRHSLETLAKSEIADDNLPSLVARAFQDALLHTAASPSASRRVPILALLRSIRVERLRHALGNGNPGKAVRSQDMPMWALLYNLDRYRRLVGRDGHSERVQFETGSQQEQAQGKSVTLNGLDATQDYQVYAHAVQRG
jgi:hypothetical protein